jgi:hypothetical protein
LSDHRHVDSQFGGVEHRGVGSQPGIGSWERGLELLDLDNVVSISSIGTLPSISCRVGITSSPLEVDVISRSNSEIIGGKVVLGGGEGLDDVSSLSSDVKVEDSVGVQNSRWSRSDVEHVRSILEGSSELGGIDGQGHHGLSINKGGLRGRSSGDSWVLGDGGVVTVHGVIDESSIGSVSVGSQISGGDVVSDSEDTVAVVVSNAREILSEGESPIVVIAVETISSVSEEVISGIRSLNAVRGGDSMSGDLGPGKSVRKTFSLVVGGSLNSIGISAEKSALHIL